MRGDVVLRVLRECADEIEAALATCPDWAEPGARPTQLRCDQVADEVAAAHLVRHGFGVLSEESGAQHLDRPVVVILDPIDGTTNILRGVPWYGPSLCALVRGRPSVAHVRNLADGTRWEAVRGEGATSDGHQIRPSGETRLERAVVATSGPLASWPVGEERRFDAMAFALCAMASGVVDAVVDLDEDHHRSWDIAGGALVCSEAGALVVERRGRGLAPLDPSEGRSPIGAATPALLADLKALLAGQRA